MVQLRKLRLQSEIDSAVIYTRSRNGRSGCGILVEMPNGQVKKPNVPGPELTLNCTFLVCEQPTINLNAKTGTQLTAEEVCELVWDILHQWQVEGACGFYAAPKLFDPVETIPGVVAYRVTMLAVIPREQTARVMLPTIAEAGLEVTLTNAAGFEDADIYWTPDGSFPAQANSAATKYDAPFTVESGTVVRWAAYRVGNTQSDVGRAVVN